jgi:hypothetical protein
VMGRDFMMGCDCRGSGQRGEYKRDRRKFH